MSSGPGPDVAAVRDVVVEGLEARAYPAAVVEVGSSRGPHWREAFGRLTYAADAPATTPATIFDLASLTKVITTASVAMALTRQGALSPDDPIVRWLPGWRHPGVTIGHLLDHSSGLAAHAPLWRTHAGRAAYLEALLATPLDYEPGTRSVYSDLGFMLLGLALEAAGGAGLDALFARAVVLPDLEPGDDLSFEPPPALRSRIAPTEQDPWRGRLLVGEVHDENAAALGGVAAHAGLFGTAGSVGAFARLVLATFRGPTTLGDPALMRRFATRSAVPGSSRALGWDTMLPTSSCGRLMSPTAIGHVGFTGTSLWIDREQDVYVVWLTNRVHPTRENTRIRALRPRFHDAVMRAMGVGSREDAT